MNLTDLLNSVGGTKSLGSLAGNLGLDASKANDLVGALTPVLMGALQGQISHINDIARGQSKSPE